MTLDQYLGSKIWRKAKILSGQCVPVTDVSYADLIILVTLRDNTINLLTENPLEVNKVLREPHEAGEIVFELIYLQDKDLYLIVSKGYIVEEGCKNELREYIGDDYKEEEIITFVKIAKDVLGLDERDIINLLRNK